MADAAGRATAASHDNSSDAAERACPPPEPHQKMLARLALALLAPAARAGDGEAPHNLRGAAVPRPPARVVAPVFPWPPDGSEPDCRDEAAWASSEGADCNEVARDAAAL